MLKRLIEVALPLKEVSEQSAREKSIRQPDRRSAPHVCLPRQGRQRRHGQFLGQSGHARNPALWLVAQAISEILPDCNKEKQLMQGLLNQQEGLEEATRQGELF